MQYLKQIEANQVQRNLFSPQNQKKNGNEKNWQKLSFKHIPTKHTFPLSHVSYLSPDLSPSRNQHQLLSHLSSKNTTPPPPYQSNRQRQKKWGGGVFFLLFSSFSLDLSSITIHKANKTKKDKTKREHVSNTNTTDKQARQKKKNRHFRFTNSAKLKISIFWYFLSLSLYKKLYKYSNRRFWKLVDRFPHPFASKFVFIIHFPCSFVYYAYNFVLLLSKLTVKLTSIRYFKNNYMLLINNVIHKTFVIWYTKYI